MKSSRSNDSQSRDPRSRAWAWIACVVSASLGAGCATNPPPRNLDLRGARIVAGIAPPDLQVTDLKGSKLGGAKTGARAGGGVGGVAVAIACLGTGPFFPLCALTFVPAGAALGAGTGAVVGVVATQGSATIEDQSAALKAEFVAISHHAFLAEQLSDRLRSEHALEIPVVTRTAESARPVDTGAGGAGEPLVLQVSVTEVGVEGGRVFALRLVAELVLRRGSSVVWHTTREVQSDTELTLEEWMTSDSKALRGVLDACVATAARRLVGGLARGIAGSPESLAPAGERYSTSCDDRPDDWRQAQAKP